MFYRVFIKFKFSNECPIRSETSVDDYANFFAFSQCKYNGLSKSTDQIIKIALFLNRN